MSPKKRKQIDPLEQAIEATLAPGSFISYNASWSFVDEVQHVANDVGKIIGKEPERATRLFETFIAACHEKAEEIDDSSGKFGMLMDDLFRGWIRARQACDADRDETSKLLLVWMNDDPYGYCHDLDREAVKVLDKKGLDAFERQVRSKFDAARTQQEEKKRFPGHARHRWGGALKKVLTAQRDVDGYIALTEETEIGVEECKAIAEMYRSRRRLDDAFAWVERGIEIARSDSRSSFVDNELREMKRALLAKLGRADEALESAWSEFQQHPSTFTYEVLMRYVAAKGKKAWHEKAMEVSENGDLSSQIELWLERNEMVRLVARLHKATNQELEDLSHYRTEPLARRLGRSRPDIAARVYRAACMRIVNAGKSKYYDAALDNIEQAKKSFAKAGLETDWQAVVADIRERHYRKKGFMAGFEEIVSGAPRRPAPTFMERAKRRWPRGGKR